MAEEKKQQQTADRNADPITGAPGAHPVGSGLGAAAGGAAAGAAGGAVGGPVGVVAGAVVGGLVGGLAGKEIAEAVDPTAEDAYWRENYRSRSYVEPGEEYDQYAPAYRYGWESRARHGGRTFDEVEADLSSGWDKVRDKSRHGWDRARHAARDAWNRVEHHAGSTSR